MNTVKKSVAEFIGTLVLVVIGCGTAMTVGCNSAHGSGYILTAFAFGLGLLTMAYSIGNVSGCHINPAVSFAMLICGKMSVKEFFVYVGSQILGAFAGSGILALIFKLGGVKDLTGGFGSNGLGSLGGDLASGLLVELVLTFIFVIAILGVTSKAENSPIAGLIIALSLVGVHILGIGLTGTSVNPARSIGPALVALIAGNTDPISVVWVFVVGPMAGAALAALVYVWLSSKKESK